ncbi:hypothetical protein A2115_00025 [Candidatus Woesebacteria bacterium GWA1_41_8]|jgi:hypothetical protein|uniref:Uncharacterized protein n=1 Tax=Candidatus Woesebacteria bacterium GWA1_41_8 TaxID=1802471 RepID=A0A1F7WK16_9BACT|nr:MAG: hypothetical protein A2115_00025 [Candidatus Woesebacteria bacterium GWA1_41_8]
MTDQYNREILGTEFEGKSFRRKVSPDLPHLQERQVRIASGYSERTGGDVFLAANEVATPSDLVHAPLSRAEELDIANVTDGPSLSTVRKRGASTPGIDINAEYRSRGGDPEYRPKKTGGFFLESSAQEVFEERQRKIRERGRQQTYDY